MYYALSVGAVARLTRFVTVDQLGDWLIVRPVKNWAHDHEGYEPEQWDEATQRWTNPIGWRRKVAEGLECPHCLSMWLSAGVLGVAVVASRNRRTRAAWGFLAAALTASYAVGHVSARIDH